jgi:hypothetical protein
VAKVGRLEERILTETIGAGGFSQTARQEAFRMAADRTADTANLIRARALGHKIDDPYMMNLRGGTADRGGGYAGMAEMAEMDATIPVPVGHSRLYRGEGVRTPSRGGHGGEEHLTGAWYNSSLRSAYTYAAMPTMTATHGGGIASAKMMEGFGHVRYVDVPTEMSGRVQVLGKMPDEPGYESAHHIGKNEYLLPENLRARSRPIGEAGPGGITPEPSEILKDPKALGQFSIKTGVEAELAIDPVKANIYNNIAGSMDVRAARFTNAAGTKSGRAYERKKLLEAKAKRMAEHLANGGKGHRSAINGAPIHRSSAPSTFTTSPDYSML